MKKNILGAKEGVCPHCSGTMVYIKLKGINVISQCLECGCAMNGRARDETKIYTFDFKEIDLYE